MKLPMASVTVLLLCVCSAAAQQSSQYQHGNVMAAQRHPPSPGEDPNVVKYDVTIKIGDMEYVVLYKPRFGENLVEYRLGSDGFFLVQKDTITFHDNMRGDQHIVPILQSRHVPSSKPR